MASVVYEKRNRIGHVTLNRPEARNALDDELNDALWEVWADFHADDTVDVAIVTGPGRPSAPGPTSKRSFRSGSTPPCSTRGRTRRGDRGRDHQGAAPDREAGHRGRQRFRDRRRVRTRPRVRHPHRVGKGEVRGIRGEAWVAPG